MSNEESASATVLEVTKALKTSEVRYRRLFEAAQDGILLLNAESAQIEDANPFLIELLGYSHDELIGKKLWEIGAFKDTALNQEAFVELQKLRYIRYDDLPLETQDGRQICVEFVSNVYQCGGVDVIQCNIRDNTKRQLAEAGLKATARILKVLSESNVALLSAKNEEKLLAEYCRILVETGGYRMVWIGRADNGPDKLVEVIHCHGYDDGYLEQAGIAWDDTPRGCGPTGRAIRTGQIQFTEDIAKDLSMSPWLAEALRRGYRSSIAVPFRLLSGAVGCMTLYSGHRNVWVASEHELLHGVAADIAFGINGMHTTIAKLHSEEHLRTSLEQTIQALADTIDLRDSYTAGHQRRVAMICSKIAVEMGLSEERVHAVHLAASIHDLGKIGIPAEILAKPRQLSAMEIGLVREHAQLGYDILKDIEFPWPIAEIIYQHHERVDGSGYPRGLTGGQILLEAKILAVADVVEAMASHRPYRPARGLEAALAEIAAHRGTAFDPEVVDACLRLFREKGYTLEE